MDSRPSIPFSGSALVVGSFICLATLIAFGILGGAIGLSLNQLSVGLGLILGALFILAFAIGGYATAAALPSARALGCNTASPYFHSFAMWSVVTVIASIGIGTQASKITETAAQTLGVGVASSVGTDALIEKLRQLRPTLVTEVKIKEGRAVSTLSLRPPSARATSSAASRSAQEEEDLINSHSDEIHAAREKAVGIGQKLGWLGFCSLLTALAASLAGTALAQRMKARLTMKPAAYRS